MDINLLSAFALRCGAALIIISAASAGRSENDNLFKIFIRKLCVFQFEWFVISII